MTTISHADTLELLEKLRNILIAVSTGTAPGTGGSQPYQELHSNLTYELRSLGLDNPIPYEDLAEWRGKWSSGDLPSYDSRRRHIRSLVDPMIRYLQEGPIRQEAIPEPTEWDLISRVQDKIRNGLASGSDEEDYQNIGLLCREVLITLAQTVFDGDEHPSLDGKETSPTDVKGMLSRYINVALQGDTNKTARKYVNAAFDLTNKLQHKRSASFRDAALCAQATFSVINFIAVVSDSSD